MNFVSKVVLIGALICASATPVFARGDKELAARTLSQIDQAIDGLRKACNFDILRDAWAEEITCGGKAQPIANAWSHALDNAGVPPGLSAREELCARIGLDRDPGFTLASGRANGEAIERLRQALKALE